MPDKAVLTYEKQEYQKRAAAQEKNTREEIHGADRGPHSR